MKWDEILDKAIEGRKEIDNGFLYKGKESCVLAFLTPSMIIFIHLHCYHFMYSAFNLVWQILLNFSSLRISLRSCFNIFVWKYILSFKVSLKWVLRTLGIPEIILEIFLNIFSHFHAFLIMSSFALIVKGNDGMPWQKSRHEPNCSRSHCILQHYILNKC